VRGKLDRLGGIIATRSQQVRDGKLIHLAEVDQLKVVDHELTEILPLDAVRIASLLRQPLCLAAVAFR
jgi:hypothetical protein